MKEGTSPSTLKTAFENFGVTVELKYNTSTETTIKNIKNNLEKGMPVLVGVSPGPDSKYTTIGHWLVLLSISGDTVTISNAGRDSESGTETDNINTLVEKYMEGNGYILVKSAKTDSATNVKEVSTDTEKKKESSSTSDKKKKTTSTKSGSQACNISNGGYDSIYTSGTTGRQFKEFKQNSGSFAYPSVVGTYWGQECSTVAIGTIGSGYKNLSFNDLAKKLNDNGGLTYLSSFLSDFCGQTVTEGSKGSVDDFANALSNGAVALIHYPGYSARGHYLAVLDINESKSEVYVSNPDVYNNPSTGAIYQGWNPISRVHNAIDQIFYVTNDGTKVDYSGTGASSSANSSVNMSGNIVKKDEKDGGGYKINIDLDKEVEEMLAYIKHENFDIGKYMKNSHYKEYLKNYIKAAIVTQYPDLRKAEQIAKDEEIPTDEVQGCIRIKRYADGETKSFAGNLTNVKDSEDDGRYLEYMPYKEFTELVKDGDKSALNYFSLDSSNNMVVAGWETMRVEITQPVQTNVDEAGPAPSTYDEKIEPYNTDFDKIVTKSIDYISQVSNYQMPFSLLWTLIVYGNDEEFVNDLANLVINTDIVIGVYDATNIKKYTHDISYSKTEIVESTVNTQDTNSQTPHATQKTNLKKVEVTYNFEAQEIDTLKTDTPTLKVKHADMWAAVYDLDYKVVTKEDKKEDTATKEDETLETNNYLYTKEHYSSNRKPNNEKVLSELDDVIKKEVDPIVNKKAEEERQKYAYRYDVIKDCIEDHWKGEEKDLYKNEELYKFLQIEDVQTNIINMILMQSSEDEVKKIFSNENAIMVKYAKRINAQKRGVSEDEGNTTTLGDVYTVVKSWVENNPSGSDLYKKLTKNGTDTGRAKTYEELYIDITITETKKKINQKEKTTTETTTATVEKVPTENSNVRMKDQKNGDENGFVKLLYHSKSAYENLRILNSWFFESMADTTAIADMVDLMKYLFMLTYDKDMNLSGNDIKEIIDSFNPESSFNTVSNSDYSNGNASTNLISFLEKAEGGDSYINGDSYTVYSTESVDGCLNIGHGVVVAQYGKAWYPDILPNPYDGQVVSKEIYEKLFNGIIKSKASNLDAALAKYGVTLNQNQYDAMVSYCYNCGADLDLLISTYKKEGEKGLWREWQKYCCAGGEQLLGLKRRRSEEYELFIKGDYDYNPVYDGYRVKYY